MENYLFACATTQVTPTSPYLLTLTTTPTTQVAIFQVGSSYYAVDNLCCHKKGNLFLGDIEDLHYLLPPQNGPGVNKEAGIDPRTGPGVNKEVGIDPRTGPGVHKEVGSDPLSGGGDLLLLAPPVCEGEDILPVSNGEGIKDCGICVRCPKHKSKFKGGLYFDLESGKALTKAFCERLDPNWRLATYKVKIVDGNIYISTTSSNGVTPSTANTGKKKCRAPVILTNIQKYNHDTFIYDFELDMDSIKIDQTKVKDKKEMKKLKKRSKPIKKIIDSFRKNYYPCWHLDLCSLDESISREYTPISSWETFVTSKKIQLLIKLYKEGLMSQILEKSNIGDKFLIGPPKCTIAMNIWNSPDLKRIACVAGGTGITPFYQMMHYFEKRTKEGLSVPNLSVVYSNKKREDILLVEELKYFQQKYPESITVIHTLSRHKPDDFDPNSGYLFGRVSPDAIEKILHPSSHGHAFVAGPSGMWTTVLSHLVGVGYGENVCFELEA